MEKNPKCECCIHIIGHINGCETFATFSELLQHEKQNPFYTIKDYCNVSKPTNLYRFNFCPKCGEKIDWEKYGELLTQNDNEQNQM